jgi:hypothetical protein
MAVENAPIERKEELVISDSTVTDGVEKAERKSKPAKWANVPDSKFGDSKNWAYPIHDLAHVRSAVAYFNHDGQREAGGYSEEEWAAIGRRIAHAAGKVYRGGKIVDKAEKEETTNEVQSQLFDMQVKVVHLVGNPANGKRWAIRKEAPVPAAENKEIGMAEVKTEVKETPVVQPVDKELVAKMAEMEAVVKAAKDEAAVAKEALAKNEARVAALEKSARLVELAPICKNVGADPEEVYKREMVNKEQAAYFMGLLDVATKRITALMKEVGQDVGEDVTEVTFETEAAKMALNDKISIVDAYDKLSKARPDLAREWINDRQHAVGGN